MAQRKRWAVSMNGKQLKRTVRAHTKSEARAYFKLMAHIPRRERLPLQYKVTEVPV